MESVISEEVERAEAPLVQVVPGALDAVQVEVLPAPVKPKVEFAISARALREELRRLKETWAQSEAGEPQEFVRFEVAETHLTLTASNIAVVVQLRLPLYERAKATGTFHILGREIWSILGTIDSLLTFTVTGESSCSVSGDNFTWNLRSTPQLKLGDDFVEQDPLTVKSFIVLREPFLEGLKCCARFREGAPTNLDGVWVGREHILATDTQSIAVFKRNATKTPLTIPGPVIPTIERALARMGVSAVGLRVNSYQVELTAGYDTRILFGQMVVPEFFSQLPGKFASTVPMFKADKRTLLHTLEGAMLGLGKGSKNEVTLSRAEGQLRITTASIGFNAFSGGFPVSWATPETELSLAVNPGALLKLVGALGGHIAALSLGTLNGIPFVRLDEDDRSLVLLCQR